MSVLASQSHQADRSTKQGTPLSACWSRFHPGSELKMLGPDVIKTFTSESSAHAHSAQKSFVPSSEGPQSPVQTVSVPSTSHCALDTALAAIGARRPEESKFDALDPSKSPERKRRHSRPREEHSHRKPPPRPKHISTKSASAVPTLSTTTVAPTAVSCSPTKAHPASRSWLGRPASMAASHDGANSHTAADLLRQAMMHG